MKWPTAEYLQKNLGKIELGQDGRPTARWEQRALITMTLPYAMRLSFRPEITIRKVRVCRGCIRGLSGALDEVKTFYGIDTIRVLGLDLFGQAYNFGLNCSGLSILSYGVAIDINPEGNQAKKAKDAEMPEKVVQIFEDHGWLWGGNLPKPEYGRFAAATL